MSGWERDSLMKVPTTEIKRRIQLAECIIADGIKECVGETNLKEVIRQRDVLIGVLKDRDRKKAPKPEGIVIKLKPLDIRVRRPLS